MAKTTTVVPGTPVLCTPEARLDLANRLYREYHTRCFWHCPRDLIITEELVPLVVKGLRKHGGRRGFILSGQLRVGRAADQSPKKELGQCP
jgi:hypothetical protein